MIMTGRGTCHVVIQNVWAEVSLIVNNITPQQYTHQCVNMVNVYWFE